MITVAVAAQKGGVGKTTTANALAAGLHRVGKRVLLMDFDPQGSLTAITGLEGASPSLYDFYAGRADLNKCIYGLAHCDAVPFDSRGWSLSEREQALAVDRLVVSLDRLGRAYDFAILDTPPALGGFTLAALNCAALIIVPTICDRFALQFLEQMSNTLDILRVRSGRPLTAGILFTRFSSRLKATQALLSPIGAKADALGGFVFKTLIRDAPAAIRGAEILGTTIFDYDARSPAAVDYSAFTAEFLKYILTTT